MTIPDYALGAHTASLGRAIPADSGLPAPFTTGAFVGQHGSWNRRPPSGYRVIFVPYIDGQPRGQPVDVLSGFLDAEGQARGRSVGITRYHRSGLLVADDVGNNIWRITSIPKRALARNPPHQEGRTVTAFAASAMFRSRSGVGSESIGRLRHGHHALLVARVEISAAPLREVYCAEPPTWARVHGTARGNNTMPDDADERPNLAHKSTRTTGNTPVDEIDPGGTRPKKKVGDGAAAKTVEHKISSGDRTMLHKSHGPQPKT